MPRTSTVLAFVVLVFFTAAPAVALADPPPYELAVRQDRLLGGTRGTLVIDQDGVEFRTADRRRAHRWDYLALKQVRILSPTRIVLDTYEDQGRLRLGADRVYEFEVLGTIPEDLVSFLLARIERPVVTAVLPPLPATALFRVPVKHDRTGRGSDGTLVLYDTGIAYLTEREGQSRFWRFGDVFGVLAPDHFRLLVLVYEGGSAETRTFTFELKTALPPGMYDALWQRVNAPDRTTQPEKLNLTQLNRQSRPSLKRLRVHVGALGTWGNFRRVRKNPQRASSPGAASPQ